MDKIDVKDKKILSKLTENSRMNLKEIAKYINLSKNTTNYRINRLQKQEYISNFVPIINYVRIGYSTFDLFIKLKIRKENEKIINNYFKNNPNVLWATTLFGEWDIFVQYITKDFYQFYENLLQEFITKFKEFVEDYEIKIAVERLKFELTIPDIVVSTKKELLPIEKNIKSSDKLIILDKLDRKIIHQLSKNARASFQQIGNLVGESLETVRYRFKKLVKTGVLVGFSTNINYEKFGYISYLVFIRFRNLTKEKEKQLANYLKNKKDVVFALRNGNIPEIYIQIICKTPYLVESLIKEINDIFFEQIKTITNIAITKEIKVDMFPRGLL